MTREVRNYPSLGEVKVFDNPGVEIISIKIGKNIEHRGVGPARHGAVEQRALRVRAIHADHAGIEAAKIGADVGFGGQTIDEGGTAKQPTRYEGQSVPTAKEDHR